MNVKFTTLRKFFSFAEHRREFRPIPAAQGRERPVIRATALHPIPAGSPTRAISANAVIGGLIHQRRQCVGSRRPGGNGLADRLDVVAIICKRDFAIRLQKDGHQERNMITRGLIISWDAQSDQWSPLWSRTPVSSDRAHGVAPTSLQWRVCLAGTRKL